MNPISPRKTIRHTVKYINLARGIAKIVDYGTGEKFYLSVILIDTGRRRFLLKHHRTAEDAQLYGWRVAKRIQRARSLEDATTIGNEDHPESGTESGS